MEKRLSAMTMGEDGSFEQNFPPVKQLLQTDKKRILVTGGAGFVGSHLVDALMAQGHDVYVLDNLFTGRKQNIRHWIGHPNFDFINHDVIEPKSESSPTQAFSRIACTCYSCMERCLLQLWEQILAFGEREKIRQLFRPPLLRSSLLSPPLLCLTITFLKHLTTILIVLEVDLIYHLACPASPPHYQYNPIKTLKTSVVGTTNMLGLASRVKARMLLTSTSEVYGDPKEHPQRETYWGNVNPIGPRACYDEGKRAAETLMYAYEEQNKVEVRVARIFNTFGPRMHPNDGRVVSNFIIQALQGKTITIYGNGEQTRSFQYVSDLVAGLQALMNSDYSQPVNIGNPQEFSIKE